MLRAVPSRGGRPGCRWHKETKRLWRQLRPTLNSGNTFDWKPLGFDDDDTYEWNILTNGYTYDWNGQMADNEVLELDSHCGYRNTHRTTSRGSRSQAALTTRRDRWQQKQLTLRHDYREWKRQQTGSTLRTPDGGFLKPPTCSQPTMERLLHIVSKLDCSFIAIRNTDQHSNLEC